VKSFSLHPNVYATGAETGLVRMLEQVWVRDNRPGDGTYYVISGFANYNGSVRFLEAFRHHIDAGGRVTCIFAGSTSQYLTSRQVVRAMLEVGSNVYVVNRKRLLHAKCYGANTSRGQDLIVTSGNFTGPGMGLNVESSAWLDEPSTRSAGFSWDRAVDAILTQTWDIHQPTLDALEAPAWRLLYDEYAGDVVLDESEETTLIVLLGHSDTARIQADPGDKAGLGTQYFWLSKDSYGFFPPLTERNQRGDKATFSCVVQILFVDLGRTEASRVTFEAENNLDFRLGTGPLRYSKVATRGDLAAISRVGEEHYELRIIQSGSPHYTELLSHAVNYIGGEGKRYGYLENVEFEQIIGIRLGRAPRGRTR
jgi:hypothetical protein